MASSPVYQCSAQPSIAIIKRNIDETPRRAHYEKWQEIRGRSSNNEEGSMGDSSFIEKEKTPEPEGGRKWFNAILLIGAAVLSVYAYFKFHK